MDLVTRWIEEASHGPGRRKEGAIRGVKRLDQLLWNKFSGSIRVLAKRVVSVRPPVSRIASTPGGRGGAGAWVKTWLSPGEWSAGGNAVLCNRPCARARSGRPRDGLPRPWRSLTIARFPRHG